jgi:hypothetical protein
MKVTNMVSSRGNTVPNQFIIQDDNGNTEFQSYETTIARKNDNKSLPIKLDPKWQYSKTTSKYLYQFLGMKRKEIENGIKSGSIIIIDLNV